MAEISTPSFAIIIYSFGYKYGIPGDVNFLFDVRSLPNPYWEEALRARSGLEKDVADYVLESSAGKSSYQKLLELLLLSIEQYRSTGKKRFRIAIGCTGGRHRSVAIAEAIAQAFKSTLHTYHIHCFHRDIEKDFVED